MNTEKDNKGKSSERLSDIPEGSALATVQLLLREKILREISHQAIHVRSNRERYTENDNSGDSETEVLGCEASKPEDRILEVVLESMEVLRHAALDVNTYLRIDDEASDIMIHALLCDLQILLRSYFRGLVSTATRCFRPTGIPVTAKEIQDQLEAFFWTRSKILQIRPGLSIAEIVGEG